MDLLGMWCKLLLIIRVAGRLSGVARALYKTPDFHGALNLNEKCLNGVNALLSIAGLNINLIRVR